VRFRVHLDGQPPGAAHGTDIDDQGDGTLTEPRLYQLIRQPGSVAERTFEVIFLGPGVQAYAFTFG
jgi:Thioredoxin like C-terminal domain